MPRTSRLTAVQDPTMKALSSLFLLPLLLLGSVAHAQKYVLTPSSEPYTSVIPLGATPVTLTATSVFGPEDEGAATIPLGFTFTLSGATYTHVNVTSNGMLELLTDANTTAKCLGSCYGDDLPSTKATAFVAPWWADLEGTTAGGVVSLASPGSLDVEYALWGYYGSSTASFNFRVTFKDSGAGMDDDTIEIRYGEHSGSSSSQATAGVQWATGSAAAVIPCATTGSCTSTNWISGSATVPPLTDTMFVLERDASPDVSVPSVVVSNFATSPGADGGVYNAQFDVEALLKNAGRSPAENMNWQAWLSKDKTCCTNDIKLHDSYADGGVAAAPVDVGAESELPVATTASAQGLVKTQEYFVIVKADTRGAVTESDESNNTGRTTEGFIFGTDLVASAVKVKAGSAVLNGQVTLQISAQNRGTTAAGTVPYEIRLFTSKTATLSTLVHQGTLTLGSVQSIVDQDVVLTLPQGIADGRYFWALVMDPANALAEVSETNNRVFSAAASVVGLDLVAEALAQAPVVTVAGAPVSLTVTLKNDGSAGATGVPYSVVLSGDKVLDSGDVVVHQGTVDLSAYQVRAQHPVQFSLPLNVPGGEFYMGLVMDPPTAGATAGSLTEVDEANNATFSSTLTTISRADLAVEEVRFLDADTGAPVTSAYMGVQRRVSVRVRNLGGDAANNFRLGVIASKDANLSLLSDWRVADAPAATSPGFSIAACTTLKNPDQCPAETFTFDVALPLTDRIGAPLAPGDLYFFVQADSFDSIIELKEDNNARRYDAPIRLFLPSPDLSTTRVQVPAASAAGETIPVYRIFKNVGVSDSPAVKYRYHVSVNELISEEDPALELFVDGMFVPSGTVTLPQGAQDTATEFVRLPESLPPGTYYVGAVIDFDGAVVELNEVNNSVASTATLNVSAPSLQISTRQLPDGTADRPYLFRLATTGTSGAVTWSATNLPAGMQLDAATGMLGGTPTLADVYAFDVTASASGRTASARLVLRVLSASTELSILTRALPPVVNTNQPYGTSLAAAGGRRPYTWRLASGSLPKGLALGADGTISGTPVTAQVQTGESTLGLEVVDANGNRATGSVKVRVVASGSLLIRTLELPDAITGSDYVADVQAVMAGTGALASPLTWSVAAGELPPGVTLTSSLDRGLMSGKALEAGLFSFTLQVEDASGRVDTADYVVRIFPNTFLLSGQVPTSLFPGDAVAITLESTSASPVSWRLFSGTLPPGVSLSAEGVISGIVNPEPERSVGTWNVVVAAKNAEGAESLLALGFKVVEKPAAAGCSAGPGGPFGWLAVLVLGALRSRRRAARTLLQGLAWVAALAAVLVPARALAQVSSSYSVSGPNPGTYRALTGPNAGSVLFTAASTSSTPGWVVQLPFTFYFYGQAYTEVGVALAGYLDFGQTDLETATNRSIPHSSATSPNRVVAAWWDSIRGRAENVTSGLPASVVSHRTFGTAPNREFVIDWANVAYSTTVSNPRFSFQVRLFEGTNRIRISYAPNASPNTATATVGILGGTGVGLAGLSCASSGNCSSSAYPAGKDIDFALPADLTVPSVSGDDTAYAGTLFHASALLRNGGGTPANSQKVRFYISGDAALDTLADAQLGETMPTDLAAGQEKQVSSTVLIPQALQPGSYFLFAYADPDFTLSEPNETNNASMPLPLTVGAPRADLQVVALGLTATTATPGQTLNVTRTFTNTGNLAVTAPVKYTYLLSDNAVVSYSDRPVTPAGTLATLAAGGSDTGSDPVVLPPELPAGRYWIGLCADYDYQANPISTLVEISEVNNCFTASQPLVVSSGSLALLTTSLPTATQLSPYGLVLEATGGNGTYAWTKTGGELPPGMTLSSGGLLQGTPARAGTFSFTVKVTSGADEKSQNLNLTVAPGGLPLVVVDQDVPAAEFGKAYAAALIAVGGKPPYTWTLAPNSQLPQGIALASDGKLEGRALEYRSTGNERWPFSVDVVDSAGVHAVKDLALRVVASTQLQVATPRLATAYLSRPYRAELRAIGGSGAFAWRLDRFQKLSQGPTDAAGEPVLASVDGDDASIPFKNATGLSIVRDNSNNRLWYLDGAPTQAGLYLLVLAVRDASGVEDRTTLTLRISYDEALQVTTPALPDAFVGQAYSVKLTSNAAEGVAVSFSVPCLLQVVMPGNTVQCMEQAPLQLLPAGLTLASDGTITGTPEFMAMEEGTPMVHSFLVQVADGQGRYDVRSLSIRLRPERTTSGCSSTGTGTGPAGWVGLALALLAFAGRRRKAVAAGLLGALALTAAGCAQRDLCKDNNVVCEDANSCDPEDGVCKCGGVGGVICAAGSTCDVDTNTCVSTRCENVVCAAGTACDVFDGKCKCGGTGGTECADGTQCDPVAKACTPLVDCRVTACPANQDCDAATGQCLCGAAACAAGEICAVSTGGGRACAPSPCAGVNCSGATVCDPADGQCKCNGAVCGGGETCSCASSAASCSDADRACTPSTLCTGVTCAGGTSCDPLDGQCKCGGPGGPVCGSGQVCALGPPPQCQGGDQCALPDGGTKICAGGTSCDPEDGVCKCGGRGGILCQPASGNTPAEVCVVTSASSACKRGCDPRSPDCPNSQYCFHDTLAVVSVSYCAAPTGTKVEAQACTAPTECFSQVPAPRSLHCLGLEPGQFGICRAYCDVQAGSASCSQVPRPQTCQQLPDAPTNVGYCLPQ